MLLFTVGWGLLVWDWVTQLWSRWVWKRERPAGSEGSGGTVLLITVLGVLLGIALWAVITTWWVPGGYQVPPHGSDWIWAVAIPLVIVVTCEMVVEDQPERYWPPREPMRALLSPAARQTFLRRWMLFHLVFLGPLLVFAAWIGHVVFHGPWTVSPLVNGGAVPGWFLISGVGGLVIWAQGRQWWRLARDYAPSPRWVWWAVTRGSLHESLHPAVVDEAVSILDAAPAAAEGTTETTAGAWAWMEELVLGPTRAPVRIVRPLLMHRDRDIRLRTTRLLGLRASADAARAVSAGKAGHAAKAAAGERAADGTEAADRVDLGRNREVAADGAGAADRPDLGTREAGAEGEPAGSAKQGRRAGAQTLGGVARDGAAPSGVGDAGGLRTSHGLGAG